VVDGYHAFMAIEAPFGGKAAQSAFYLAGGYKYAMAGEGCAFLHAPPGFGPRPRITGWYAEFEDLTLPPGSVGYAKDAMRFMGATFDASGLYRFTAIQRMLRENGLTTKRISDHVEKLQRRLIKSLPGTVFGSAELLNPLDGKPHARFLAFRSPQAQRWCRDLAAQNCIVDVRGDVLRVGLGLNHDDSDIDRFVSFAARLS
jgi:selenocysteine lyase/cysteine desulfurase